jgi:hypothetical protein
VLSDTSKEIVEIIIIIQGLVSIKGAHSAKKIAELNDNRNENKKRLT